MHDCLPTSERMQLHLNYYPGGEWTGDVWKAFVKARTTFRHLMYTVTTDYGCGVIDTRSECAEDTSQLPTDMESMTYEQFVEHPEWMNRKGGIIK